MQVVSLLLVALGWSRVDAFSLPRPTVDRAVVLYSSLDPNKNDDPAGVTTSVDAPPPAAATGTVNERLLNELQQAANQEKYGAKSQLGQKLGLDAFQSSKTDEERKQAIAEARDLNGVNPIVTTGGGIVALALAAGLWFGTNAVIDFFVLHPVESDVYFVQRSTQVVRNVVVGLMSLASGFFGVTGLGILALGIRVAYGVTTGELDPTPIKKVGEELEMPNVWDLMQNKQPGRRRRK